jgi:hypothetical protein
MSKKLRLKTGTAYRYFEWGSEPCGEVTVWHAGADDSVCVDGLMGKAEALAAGVKFDCPYN